LYTGQLAVGTPGNEFYFPAARAGTSKILKSDGSGNLTWAIDEVAAPGSGSNWSFGTEESWIRPSSTDHAVGLFVNASSTIEADLRIAGNLAIGTTSPDTQLAVVSSANTVVPASFSGFSNDQSANLFELGKYATATPLLTIDSSGNLNTTGYASSTTGLFTQGNIHAGGNLTIDGNATSTGSFSAGQLNIAGNIYFPTTDGLSAQVLTSDGSGNLSWANTVASANWVTDFDQTTLRPSTTRGIFVRASSTIDANFRVDGSATTTGSFYVGTNNLVVLEGGNVGIGSASPGYKLDIVGNTYITGNATTTGSFNIDNDLTVDGTALFASTALSIDSSGNLNTTGYASSTTGLFTQGNMHTGGNLTIDGNATITGSLYTGQLAVGTPGNEFYFPAARAGISKILKSDGSGNLTWAIDEVAAPGSGSNWSFGTEESWIRPSST
ncbi:hypothetical protein LCGC14_2687150, partial [marine sediment metagenome]